MAQAKGADFRVIAFLASDPASGTGCESSRQVVRPGSLPDLISMYDVPYLIGKNGRAY
jgi:hypothetical protein